MTWHLRIGKYARAFTTQPKNPISVLALLLCGWKPFNQFWWSKPSNNQKKLEDLK